MSRTLQEQIEVMQHYANGGEVEYCDNAINIWDKKDISPFDWKNIDYRIKEQKKTITIEKWVLEQDNEIAIIEGNQERIDSWSSWKKLKLLDTYEVEL